MYEIFFVKQMTAYVVRISDWSSDVCSSDLCNPLLHRLLSGMEGIAAVAARPCRGAYDLHAPLMSLPHIFGAEGDAVPPAVPYLPVPPPMALAATARRKVGLVWAGNPDHARHHERSRALRSEEHTSEL